MGEIIGDQSNPGTLIYYHMQKDNSSFTDLWSFMEPNNH